MEELQSLKSKIMSLAIQGKLTAQSETDEPASVLLQKIKEEKEWLVKEKKIKKDKFESRIYKKDNCWIEKIGDTEKDITKDIPFDIPDSWQWVRLGSVIKSSLGGGTPSKSVNSYWNGDIFWATGKDLTNKNFLEATQDKITLTGLENSSSNIIPQNNIIICTRMGLGKIVYSLIDVAINQDLRGLFFYNCIDKFYFMNFYSTLNFGERGVTVNGITIDFINNILFPLPPLAEQERIVKKVEEIFKQIDIIQTNREELDKLKLALKNKLLSLAIQGKLVKQTETDTPVSELLHKIQEEKNRLVKEKKIKKDKLESHIYKKNNRWIEKIGDTEKDITNDIPFEIPVSWQWVRLGMLCNVIMGQSPDGATISSESNGIEFHQGKLFFDSKYLKKSSMVTSFPKKIAPINSILLCVRAPVGKINITTREVSIGRGLCAIQNYNGYLLDFLYNTLLLNEDILVSQAIGSTFQSITVDTVINLLVPLPPIEEQHRITQKLEKFFSLCENL